MKIYLVGGAVRDQLLGEIPKERDWVVIGSTAEYLLEKGFQPVGKDFPVFLHPETHEEYALGRTECKVGSGYRGFSCYASPDVTLEQDLLRRDLTINAMAMSDEGLVIDPYGGRADLERKQLRHVSPAFVEDPLRILRVARFAARFTRLGFSVAPETMILMREMVRAGEVSALVSDRVWQECARALLEPDPQEFFRVLRKCGALAILFPEIDRLFGVPNVPKNHPEIDTGVHTLLSIKQAALLSDDGIVRFACLLHDLGKGNTSFVHWPAHPGHEVAGALLVEQLCQRIRVPTAYRNMALSVSKYHTDCHRAQELSAAEILALMNALDAFRRPMQWHQFLVACEADSRGRPGFEEAPYPQRAYLEHLYQVVSSVSVEPLIAQGLEGALLGNAIQQQRLTAIEHEILSKRSH